MGVGEGVEGGYVRTDRQTEGMKIHKNPSSICALKGKKACGVLLCFGTKTVREQLLFRETLQL